MQFLDTGHHLKIILFMLLIFIWFDFGQLHSVLADSSLISQKQATVFLTSDLEILKDEKATHLICSYFIGSLKF